MPDTLCFLRSNNMNDPDPYSGLEMKNGFIYEPGPVNESLATKGKVNIDSYKFANSVNILTFDGTTDNVYPTFSIDGTFTDIIEQAVGAGAKTMQLDFYMNNTNTQNHQKSS